ncbi:MAG: hypothetical protein COV67_07480 [Nitrospinae bacterium CG11_big_fil_rev_8_21_14_0_20_56_8]|nr:MAG: hypothetical protein COV67_07480 [Nitrospinae bacterium CG11_big_fil_rev_8_21_14_0_20_56_8]
MPFDFMKNFMMLEDEEKFARLCEAIDEAIHEVDGGEGKLTDLEVMQALDWIGFNLFRDDWEEFRKMDLPRDISGMDFHRNNKGRNLIN